MKKRLLNKNKGVTMMDIVVAITLLTLFIGVIGELYYIIAVNNAKIRYNAIATYYTVKIVESIDKIAYEDVTNDLNTGLREQYDYPDFIDISINVENYNEGNIIKVVTVNAKYNALGTDNNYQIKKLKIKEK